MESRRGNKHCYLRVVHSLVFLGGKLIACEPTPYSLTAAVCVQVLHGKQYNNITI